MHRNYRKIKMREGKRTSAIFAKNRAHPKGDLSTHATSPEIT